MRHHIAPAGRVTTMSSPRTSTLRSISAAATTVRAAAAVEASVAAKVPAVAAVKSLPDRLYG